MSDPQQRDQPPLRGLYRNVKISVRALDTVIVVCVLVIVAVLALELRDPGFTVTFDSRGGSDVAAVRCQYGQTLAPETPTREGYVFTGWYTDPAGQEPWEPETDTVQGDLTLYAGWTPAPASGG